jgi:predicted transcriptional regulator
MSKTAVITARVDEETLALVDRVSKAHNRSRAWFVSRAITEAARKEAEFLAFVQEGIDAADRGELVPHDEVFERVRARRRARQAAE